jgi:protein phosphatase
MTMQQSTTIDPAPLDVAGGSDIGCVRRENQDAWLVDEPLKLAIVADGMGGGPAGALAAQTVVRRMAEIMRQVITSNHSKQEVSRRRVARRLLRETVSSVSQEILNMSEDDLELKGMGATVVAAWHCGSALHLAHQGDSRAYLFRDCLLRPLTADHSIVALLVRNGEITEQEALNHPARGQLTRFVGMPGDVYCDVQTLKIEKGDRLLLCTDGLWGVVSDVEIATAFMEQAQTADVCNSLIKLAVLRGAPDNVTAVAWNLGL